MHQTMQVILHLRMMIKLSYECIKEIEESCPHDNVESKVQGDIRYGWGWSKTCNKCGKCVGTGTTYDESSAKRQAGLE